MSPNARRAAAFGVLGAGVLAIFAVSIARQREQTEEFARVWVGGQWDVARNCLVGTPIGRGDSEEEIAEQLDRQLIDALLAIEGGEEDPVWPARCAPILRTLEVDRSVMRRDPGDALARLQVLSPRVLGEGSIDVAAARARSHELANAIHTLDRAMPIGEEYDRPEAREETVPIDRLLASFACDPPAQTGCAAEPPAVAACEGTTRAEAVPHAGGWHVTVCREETCGRATSIDGGDLRLAIHGDRVLALTTGERSDLTFARVLENGRWTEPSPIARGVVTSNTRGFRIDTCDGAIESRDGSRWRATNSVARP